MELQLWNSIATKINFCSHGEIKRFPEKLPCGNNGKEESVEGCGLCRRGVR